MRWHAKNKQKIVDPWVSYFVFKYFKLLGMRILTLRHSNEVWHK